MDLSTARTSN